MNHVGIVGRITKDPELRYYNEKRPYSVFTLAINRSYKNTQGNVEADFIQCVAWGKLAETITKYCGKGSMIGVNGRLNSKTFLNHEKKKVYSIDVVAEDVRFYQLKSPASANVDLAEFEQPEEAQFDQYPYNQAQEQLQDTRPSEHHSIVAETKQTMSPEEENELPIPS